MRNREKTYYCCFIRENEELIVSQTLQQIADTLQLHRNTVRKYLQNGDKYTCEGYILWKNVEIDKIKRGFALRKRV